MVNNAYIEQALNLLKTFEIPSWRTKIAIKQLTKLNGDLTKEGTNLKDLVDSPTLQNIVNILGPLALYWKADQVLKLLQEHQRELKKTNDYNVPSL